MLVELDRRTYESYIFNNSDNSIEIIESINPSKEFIIISHGFAGSKEMMRQIAYDIANAGSNAVLFDFIGHGSNQQKLVNQPTEITGTTQQLVTQLSDIIEFIYEKFGNEISISLVGHSMASDIVIRASADERIKSVIAISPYSTGITPDFPKDLLLISGQFENHLRSHALKMVKSFRPDAEENTGYGDERIRRKASYIKSAGHVSVIYAPQTTKIIIDWLKLENYDRPFWKTQIGWILIGMTFIVIGMSRLNNNLANETILVLANEKALRSVLLATLVSLSSGLIGINLLTIYGFERVAIYFGLIGLFAYLFSFDYQITKLKIDLPLLLKLILCFGVLCFLINGYIGSFTLSDNRITAFITLILPITLFCLVIEKLIAGSSIWISILLRGLPVIGFSILLILFPEQYGLMFTTVLIYIFYFIVFGYIGRHQRKKIGYLKVGVTHGVFLSFSFAATNPIFAL
ncbi:MAG: alpha/beta hydrolase [Rhodobacteraceae bacterium]|nr:alpha/beta hydrolase [Paracoccaceae bacterium]